MKKNKKLLVDTSAWIMSFKGLGPKGLQDLLKEAIDRDRVVTTPLIVLELLQGCKTEQEFHALKARLEALEQCDLQSQNWKEAYLLAFTLRRNGLTIPTVDILIAFLAMEHGFVLLHHDKHFRLIAKHLPLETIDFLD